MGRIGVLPDALPALLDDVGRAERFHVDGIFSHFASADSVDREYSDYQLRVFRQAVDTLARAGERPRYVHIANSAATLSRPDTHFTMVRPGIILYGAPPAPRFGWDSGRCWPTGSGAVSFACCTASNPWLSPASP
jgi:alanine racemase